MPAQPRRHMIGTAADGRRDREVGVERRKAPTARVRALIDEANGAELDELEVRRPTIEDVYLELTSDE